MASRQPVIICPRRALVGTIRVWCLEAAVLLSYHQPADDLIAMVADCAEQAFNDVKRVEPVRVGGGDA